VALRGTAWHCVGTSTPAQAIRPTAPRMTRESPGPGDPGRSRANPGAPFCVTPTPPEVPFGAARNGPPAGDSVRALRHADRLSEAARRTVDSQRPGKLQGAQRSRRRGEKKDWVLEVNAIATGGVSAPGSDRRVSRGAGPVRYRLPPIPVQTAVTPSRCVSSTSLIPQAPDPKQADRWQGLGSDP